MVRFMASPGEGPPLGSRDGTPAGGRAVVEPPAGAVGSVGGAAPAPAPDAPAPPGNCTAGMFIMVRAPTSVAAVTAPHCPQNLAFSGSVCPHWVQERFIVVDPARVKENV
jgi:hypothetical protein